MQHCTGQPAGTSGPPNPGAQLLPLQRCRGQDLGEQWSDRPPIFRDQQGPAPLLRQPPAAPPAAEVGGPASEDRPGAGSWDCGCLALHPAVCAGSCRALAGEVESPGLGAGALHPAVHAGSCGAPGRWGLLGGWLRPPRGLLLASPARSSAVTGMGSNPGLYGGPEREQLPPCLVRGSATSVHGLSLGFQWELMEGATSGVWGVRGSACPSVRTPALRF